MAFVPQCLTDGLANDQLLYFTSSSLTADGQTLTFISDRSGDTNLFCRHLPSGQQRQLTHNQDGYLKSYVYFYGTPFRGLGRASVSLDAAGGILYFIHGRNVCRVDLQGRQTVLAELPDDQVTAFTHVSADGRLLCVPTTDAPALAEEVLKDNLAIDRAVQAQGLSSYLRVYDTATGELLACEQVKRAWITHVQFSPADRTQILYNHEWPSDCGIRRMWLWDGKQHLRLRPEGEGRSRTDWTCHEMWERDGQAIIYHGAYADGRPYLGRVNRDGSGMVEIELPTGSKAYGHFTEGPPEMLVCDGYYDGPDGTSPGQWISLVRVDWTSRRINWLPLCRHGSSWRSQDAHPHPIFSHDATGICYTSDVSGKLAVYRVEVPAN